MAAYYNPFGAVGTHVSAADFDKRNIRRQYKFIDRDFYHGVFDGF